MKLAQMGGGSDAEVVEVADPCVADNFALVKVYSAPLCTEFKQINRPRRGGFGHEAAGQVVAIGPNVRTVKVGDRVAVMPQSACGKCDLCVSGEYIYCQSPRDALRICNTPTGREMVGQYVIQQDWLLVRFPDSIPYDHAAMACCGFGPGFNAMQSMDVTQGDIVLVSGLGPVGLGAAAVALHRGARVWGLEVNEFRIGLARRVGIETIFDPRVENVKDQILDATSGVGVPKCVDTTRLESSARLLVAVARRRGQIAFIGQGGTIDVAPLVNKGLTVRGCWHWNHSRDAKRMIETIAGSAERIETMITHRFPIDRIHDAMQVQINGVCGKVIIHPWSDQA